MVETALAPLRERRAQLVSGQRGEQRKLVSVLFADLVDFTVLSRQLDPEDTRSVVDRFARWQTAIEAHGGVVEKFIGDAVMAVFGLRRSYEDDAERAVRAGLAMTQATASWSAEVEARFGVTPRMRVGIDTGEVVVSTLGERAGHEFVAVGPTVNRASRLQSAAPEGRARVDRDVPPGPPLAFVHSVPGLELKGLGCPVDAWLIVSERRAFRLDQLGVVEGIEASTVGQGRRDPVPPGAVPRRRRRGSASRRRRRRRRRNRQEPAAARLRPVARGTAASGGGSAGARFHVEQNRANSLTRDVIATRMEIAESDPPGVVREARGRLRPGLRGG